MDNEELIELVKQYTFLYDLSDRRYSDSQKKDAAWKDISRRLKVHESTCKKSWSLLRDSFRRAIKKRREAESGQTNMICKKWKYEDEMSFLLPYLKERPSCTVTPQYSDHDDWKIGFFGEGSMLGHLPNGQSDDHFDNEKLIDLVRQYPYLYDLNDKRYSDNQRKDAAWKEISRTLKVNENKCKKAWFLLRDSCRRAIKKRYGLNSGQANIPYKKWKYEEEMSFLIPHFKERFISSTVADPDEDVDECNVNLVSEGFILSLDYPRDELSMDNNPSSPTTTTGTTTVIRNPRKKARRSAFKSKKPTSEEAQSCAAIMKYILDNEKKTDDVETFFAGIATTVKSFPLRERAIAKAKVFDVISRMEMDILSYQSTASENQFPSSFY